VNPRAALASCGFVLAAACSDGSGPSVPPAGAFSAQLTGSRFGTLSGTSNAGEVFIEELNGFFAIRMFDESGDVLRFVILDCPGETAPAVGTYAIGPAAACHGRYGRAISSLETGFVMTEVAEAAGGRLTITAFTGGEIDGAFAFHGELIADSIPTGTLSVAGAFRAVVF